jgi:hypothetical protein
MPLTFNSLHALKKGFRPKVEEGLHSLDEHVIQRMPKLDSI